MGFGLYAWQVPLLICGAAGMIYATWRWGMGLCPTAKPANAELTDCQVGRRMTHASEQPQSEQPQVVKARRPAANRKFQKTVASTSKSAA